MRSQPTKIRNYRLKSYNYFPLTYKHHQKKSVVVSDKDRYKTKVKLMFSRLFSLNSLKMKKKKDLQVSMQRSRHNSEPNVRQHLKLTENNNNKKNK